MKRIEFFWYFLIVFFIIQVNAFGGDKIIFGTFPIPGLVIDEKHGALIELTRAIAERANFDIEVIVKPPKRILGEFIGKKTDVLFPALDVNFSNPYEIIKSEGALYTKKDFIFTRRGEPLLTTIKDLEGKLVGLTLGYPYSKKLTENCMIRFDMALGDTNNVLKLINKRIDAFVAEESTGLVALQKKGLIEKVQYDPTSPISETRDYYAFHNNEKGQKLAKVISRILSEMKKDGTYAKIINKKK